MSKKLPESKSESAVTARTPNPASPWTPERCAEFKQFEELLREVRTINHGSAALERIQKCITIADALSKIDLENCRSSFVEFIKEQAIASRFPDLNR